MSQTNIEVDKDKDSKLIKEIEDELWDHYSGLPNPMWYQRVKELEDEEDNSSDSSDNRVTT